MTTLDPAEEVSYEALMARLIAVVDRLEQGELALAVALALYEEGVRLSAACQQLLAVAELHVQRLSVASDGIVLEAWDGR